MEPRRLGGGPGTALVEANENCNQHISLYSGKVAKRPRVIASRCAFYLIVMTLIRQMRGRQTPPDLPHFPSVSAQVLSMALPPALPFVQLSSTKENTFYPAVTSLRCHLHLTLALPAASCGSTAR